MNKVIGEEWVRRLESGGYKQGRGYLRTDDTYCCLGVLCEMAVEAGIVSRRDLDPEDWEAEGLYEYGNGIQWRNQFLPNEVMEWAGLAHTNPDAGMESLSGMNDSGMKFPEIAKQIRTWLLDPEPIPA